MKNGKVQFKDLSWPLKTMMSVWAFYTLLYALVIGFFFLKGVFSALS